MKKIYNYLSSILSGLFLISLFLPFASVVADSEYVDEAASQGMNGFQAVTNGGFWGLILLITPFVILAFKWIKALNGYSKIVNLAFPVFSFVSLFAIKSYCSAAIAGADAAVSQFADVKIKYQFGYILMMIVVIALVALGVIEFFNIRIKGFNDQVVTETKSVTANVPSVNTEEIVNNTKAVISNIADKAKTAAATVSENVSNRSMKSSEAVPCEPVHKNTVVNTTNMDETVNNISKLFDMKEKGMITEEEYNSLKKEFLDKLNK